MSGEVIDEKESELFELAYDNKLIEFFDRLPSVLPPIGQFTGNISKLQQARDRRDAARDKKNAALELKRRAAEELAKKKGKAHNDE